MNTILFNIQYNSVSKLYTVTDKQTGFRISFESLEGATVWMDHNEHKAGKAIEPTFTQEQIRKFICDDLANIQSRIELIKRNVRFLDHAEVNQTLIELEMMQEMIRMRSQDLA